jgi:thioesterase domain-containing protein
VAKTGHLTWEECGGDSLATLHLLVLLEKALGRKLSFDLIQPDVTAIQLAALLEAPRTEVEAAPLEATTLFLFPGMLGDEPRLAGFRRSFAGRVRFDVVEHPEVTSPRAVLTDVAATARIGAATISARQRTGPLHLVGYSYGGSVAFEAARQLHASGRQIAFLGIIDTALESKRPPLLERPRRMALRFLGRSDACRRTLFRVFAGLHVRWSIAARCRLLSNYRHAAIARWRPSPFTAPSLLVTSEQFGDSITEGWLRLCPEIRVLRVPAGHETLFEGAALDVLTRAFEAALCTRTPTPLLVGDQEAEALEQMLSWQQSSRT